MATKWDDDDVERPPAKPVKTSITLDVDEWQAKLKKAEKGGPVTSPRDTPKATVKRTTHEPPKKGDAPPPPAELPESEANRLSAAARASAEDVLRRAGTHRRVRLRINVAGWYPGSVPAVDFMDGHHFFARAPGHPPETHDEYNRYWRLPFIEHLKKLGFEVVEQDFIETK